MANLRLSVDTYWTSPYAFSAFVALKEKGLPFSVHPVGLHLELLPDPMNQRPAQSEMLSQGAHAPMGRIGRPRL